MGAWGREVNHWRGGWGPGWQHPLAAKPPPLTQEHEYFYWCWCSLFREIVQEYLRTSSSSTCLNNLCKYWMPGIWQHLSPFWQKNMSTSTTGTNDDLPFFMLLELWLYVTTGWQAPGVLYFFVFFDTLTFWNFQDCPHEKVSTLTGTSTMPVFVVWIHARTSQCGVNWGVCSFIAI